MLTNKELTQTTDKIVNHVLSLSTKEQMEYIKLTTNSIMTAKKLFELTINGYGGTFEDFMEDVLIMKRNAEGDASMEDIAMKALGKRMN